MSLKKYKIRPCDNEGREINVGDFADEQAWREQVWLETTEGDGDDNPLHDEHPGEPGEPDEVCLYVESGICDEHETCETCPFSKK